MRYDTIWFNTALDYANAQHGDNARRIEQVYSRSNVQFMRLIVNKTISIRIDT